MDFGLRIEDRIPAGPPGLRWPPRACMGWLYKQTQLVEAGHRAGVGRGGRRKPQYSSIPSFHHSSPMPIVRNEPNSGPCRVGRGLRDGGRGASAPNKANFGHGKTKDKWFTEKELWRIARAIGFGKTKPICPNGPRGARDG